MRSQVTCRLLSDAVFVQFARGTSEKESHAHVALSWLKDRGLSTTNFFLLRLLLLLISFAQVFFSLRFLPAILSSNLRWDESPNPRGIVPRFAIGI